MKRILVAGGGGFIGGWLVKELLSQGNQVSAIDNKPLDVWSQVFPEASNTVSDLSSLEECIKSTKNIDEVYNLAADMGGMGFIENNKAACMLSVLINTHLLLASKENAVSRYFFASVVPILKAVATL